MKHFLTGLFFLTLLFAPVFSQEPELKTLGDPVDYLDMMLNNNIFPKNVEAIDYRDGFLYLLDQGHCLVFKLDFKTGKLEKTIFKRGQGPSELMLPVSIKVCRDRIYVLDRGFNGIKIAALDGTFVNEFKVNGTFGDRNLEVNSKGEILVGQYDGKTNTYINVYDDKGKFLKSIVQIPTDKEQNLKRIHYTIKLDSAENIIILFPITYELMKFDKTGALLWKTDINNDLLKPFQKGSVKASSDGTVNTFRCVFGLGILKNDAILVGHCGGGCAFDSSGKLKFLVTFKDKRRLGTFKLIDSQLLNVLIFGRHISLYAADNTLE